VKPQVSEIE